MSRFFSFITSPAGLLYLFLSVTQFIAGLYAARGVEPPGSYNLFYYLVLLWLMGWWLQKDSRKHRFKWIYDLGFFLTLAWPFILPYYLFKTRGIKALLIILGFLAVYLGMFIIGIVSYLMFTL